MDGCRTRVWDPGPRPCPDPDCSRPPEAIGYEGSTSSLSAQDRRPSLLPLTCLLSAPSPPQTPSPPSPRALGPARRWRATGRNETTRESLLTLTRGAAQCQCQCQWCPRPGQPLSLFVDPTGRHSSYTKEQRHCSLSVVPLSTSSIAPTTPWTQWIHDRSVLLFSLSSAAGLTVSSPRDINKKETPSRKPETLFPSFSFGFYKVPRTQQAADTRKKNNTKKRISESPKPHLLPRAAPHRLGSFLAQHQPPRFRASPTFSPTLQQNTSSGSLANLPLQDAARSSSPPPGDRRGPLLAACDDSTRSERHHGRPLGR